MICFVWFLHQLNWLIHPLHFWCDCIKMLLLFKGFVLWIFYNKNFSFRIFRVALLFICQGSCFVCLTQLWYSIIIQSLCQELFYFFQAFFIACPPLFATCFMLPHFQICVNTFFIYFPNYFLICIYHTIKAKKKNLDIAKILFSWLLCHQSHLFWK